MADRQSILGHFRQARQWKLFWTLRSKEHRQTQYYSKLVYNEFLFFNSIQILWPAEHILGSSLDNSYSIPAAASTSYLVFHSIQPDAVSALTRTNTLPYLYFIQRCKQQSNPISSENPRRQQILETTWNHSKPIYAGTNYFSMDLTKHSQRSLFSSD